jgi:hypothetical protein
VTHYFTAVYAGLTTDEMKAITETEKCRYMAHSHLAYERDDLRKQRDELVAALIRLDGWLKERHLVGLMPDELELIASIHPNAQDDCARLGIDPEGETK